MNKKYIYKYEHNTVSNWLNFPFGQEDNSINLYAWNVHRHRSKSHTITAKVTKLWICEQNNLCVGVKWKLMASLEFTYMGIETRDVIGWWTMSARRESLHMQNVKASECKACLHNNINNNTKVFWFWKPFSAIWGVPFSTNLYAWNVHRHSAKGHTITAKVPKIWIC